MSDKRISQLVARVTLANNDVFPIVASGAATTNKVTLQTIDDYMQTNLDFGVTSVAMSVPTGLTVTGTPITSTGTFVVTFTAGYSIPTTAKQTQWDTAYTNRITSATAPLGIASNVISITQSGAASNGYLSSTDWNTFNNKQATITTGNLTEATSSVLTITGGTGSVLGSGTTIQVTQATGSVDGFLDSADWTTFNGKQNALSGTGIVKSTGGTISYLTDSTSNWDSAYNDKINSAAVTGTTTKTLTLTQQDGGTIVATWTDDNTDAVTSVFGRTGAVVATSGDYNTSQVTENTNLYYTDTRARLALSGSTGISYNNTTGAISSTITQYTDALARAAISESVTGLDYSSATGVLSTTAGYGIPTTANQTLWTAAYEDTIISAAVTGTTTKTLTLTQRDSTTITASWTDINTDAVSSVFGRTGAVVATSGDYTTTQVTEGTNLYFTNTRSRSSISLTTTGTSGAATYDSATGVFNIPSYVGGVTSVFGRTGAVVAASGDYTSTQVTEGTNLYFTDARARAAISLTTTGTSGAATYTAGVLNIPNYTTDLTGYVTIASAQTITGVKTFSANLIVNGNIVYINGGQPETRYTENDVGALPLGLWRTVLGGDAFYLQKNTAVAGDFSTTIDCLKFATSGAATFNAATQDAIQTAVRMAGFNASSQLKALDFKLTAGTPVWTITTAAVGTDAGINIMPNGSAGLSLAYSTGAATFSSSLTIGDIVAFTPSGFGYSPSTYKVLIVGQTGNSIYKTLSFGVDVSANASGSFSGQGGEYLWRNAATFITPNASNNGFNTLLSWNSSGQVTINNLVTSGLTVGSNLTLGDYTASTSLTFASSSNGIAKINFYDANSTEGLYMRTDGEAQGGTMTFGARWDDDEAKIVFKMYQVSAGGAYNARVGIGTGAISPLSMLHVCETSGGNFTGETRVGGNTSQFGVVTTYTQEAATTGTIYTSPGYSSSTILFKMGAGSGNTNQLVLKGNSHVGINIASPQAILDVSHTAGTTNIIRVSNGEGNYRWRVDQGFSMIMTNAAGSDTFSVTTAGALQTSSTILASGVITTNNSFVNTSSGTAEIRLQGGGYGANYNTSLRSIAGATGILQFGNNGTNYVLIGNTGTGPTELQFRVNCASESTAAGVAAMTINVNGSTNFYNTLTCSADVIAFSDIRLKTNIETIDNANELVSKMRGVFYNRIDTEDKSRKVGVIAQEMQKILPEVVSTDKDGTLGVAYGNIVAVLIEAVKNQQEQINDLKKQVA